jgi:hypothetical protein
MPRTNAVGTTALPGSGAQRCAQAGEREHITDSTTGIAATTAAWSSPLLSAYDGQRCSAARRDAPVNCPSCGREVQRRARQQRFCSGRCKEKARTRVRKAFLGRDTRAPSNPPKKVNKLKVLQRAKTLSSNRIFGPADVLDAEVFNRPWESATSSAGVAIEIGRLRHRALVAP